MKLVTMFIFTLFSISSIHVSASEKDECTGSVLSYVKALDSLKKNNSISESKRIKAKKESKRIKRLRSQNITDCEVAEKIPVLNKRKQALKIIDKLFQDK